MTFAKTLHTVAAIVMVIYLGDITVVNALYVNLGSVVVETALNCLISACKGRLCSRLS
jgi:hypothetical protein